MAKRHARAIRLEIAFASIPLIPFPRNITTVASKHWENPQLRYIMFDCVFIYLLVVNNDEVILMQMSDRTGIACDYCGAQYKNDFTYYSWDFRLISVIKNQRPQLNHIFRTKIASSLDICTSCFDKLKEKVVHNYSSIMDNKSALTICEISGIKMIGTYDYYHVAVTKVIVRMTGQPSICTKCQAKTFDSTKACAKCQNVDFIKPASMNTDKRHVELNLSEETFSELRKNAEQVRKVAGQWQTKS